jgi:hypothetical protein
MLDQFIASKFDQISILQLKILLLLTVLFDSNQLLHQLVVISVLLVVQLRLLFILLCIHNQSEFEFKPH